MVLKSTKVTPHHCNCEMRNIRLLAFKNYMGLATVLAYMCQPGDLLIDVINVQRAYATDGRNM